MNGHHVSSRTTALRRQIVRYLTTVKQQSTLERRVAALLHRLEQHQSRKAKRRPPEPS
jgi:hypothetical protein